MKFWIATQGYFKLSLVSLINFDISLLKFPDLCTIKPHRDVVPGKEFRVINIWLKKPKQGGIFYTANARYGSPRLYLTERVINFRPDVLWHGMTEVRYSSGYMLSIGWTTSEDIGPLVPI